METHENIKRLRELKGLSQEALAEMVGYTDRSSIAKIEAGKVDLTQSKIAAFAAALSVSPARLMGIEDRPAYDPSAFSPLPRTKEWHVLGATACGRPIHEEIFDETVTAPEDIKADVVFRCVGDSMINARIFDGDLVFIRLRPEVENGRIAVVRIGDEYTLKKVYYFPEEGRLVLRPCNPLMSDKVFTGEQLNDIEIVGEAVSFLSAVRHE